MAAIPFQLVPPPAMSRPFLGRLDEALEEPRARFLGNRLVRAIDSGRATRGLYLGLLQETYHFVRHTPIHLRMAAQGLRGGDRGLRDRFLRHAYEEAGHDLWALEDLEVLGVDPDTVRDSVPLAQTTALIAYQFFTVTSLDPKAILGLEYAMEGVTAQAAGDAMRKLQDTLDLPVEAMRFFSRHAMLDAAHVVDDARIIERYVRTPAEERAVVRNARDSLELYAAVYDAVCERAGL